MAENTGNNYKRSIDKKPIKCFNCEEYGHYAFECKAPKKNGDKANLAHLEEHALLLTIYREENDNMVLLNEENVFPRKKRGKE